MSNSAPRVPRIFLAHSHADDEFAVKLASDLRREFGEGSVWADAAGGLKAGDAWWNKIVDQITACDVFIVILSPDAVASTWVREELNIAWHLRSRIGGKTIVPVLFRPADAPADLMILQRVSFLPPHTYEESLAALTEAIRQGTVRHREESELPVVERAPLPSDVSAPESAKIPYPDWRLEPEISLDRQRFLALRRTSAVNVATNSYPFKDVTLSRGDIEWLLATHGEGRGPLDWTQQDDRQRRGLDLRGAIVRGLDLGGLPLAGLVGGLGGLTPVPGRPLTAEQLAIAGATDEQRQAAAIDMEGATLRGAQLQGAILWSANMRRVTLSSANLEGVNLSQADLVEAKLDQADLKAANLAGARLQRASLREADLEGANLTFSLLHGANLWGAHLQGCDLAHAELVAPSSGASRHGDRLPLGGQVTKRWSPADLRRAYFDTTTNLEHAIWGARGRGAASVVDAHWNGVNLTVVKWSDDFRLGDERLAQERRTPEGTRKSPAMRTEELESAIRAYRQISAVLRDQGLRDESDGFAYRAQVLQRSLYRKQGRLLAYGFALFLDLLAGYGYRPIRSLAAYLVVIVTFAGIYHYLGLTNGPALQWREALVVSMTAFHGRGFFPQQFKPGDPQAMAAAVEAFVGLIIEVSFIATFTQRFFARS